MFFKYNIKDKRMDWNYFWDVFSATLIGVIMYPIMQYVITLNPSYLILLAGIIITDLSTKLFKYLTKKDSPEFAKRPQGAFNCDIICRDGNQSGKAGMPSGHMATLTFALVFMFMAYVYRSNVAHAKTIYSIFAVTYICMMSYARHTKKCHNSIQIIIGIVWGAFLAGVFFGIFGKLI